MGDGDACISATATMTANARSAHTNRDADSHRSSDWSSTARLLTLPSSNHLIDGGAHRGEESGCATDEAAVAEAADCAEGSAAGTSSPACTPEEVPKRH